MCCEDKLCSLKIKIVLQISDEVSVQSTAALSFRWSRLWHRISILYNHLSVPIRRVISHSHVILGETSPKCVLLKLKVVHLT